MGTTFGQRLLQARLELSAQRGRQIGLGDMAASLGVTAVTYSRWEAGTREPSLETIARIAAVLGANPGHLAFGDGSSSSAAAPRAVKVPSRDRESSARDLAEANNKKAAPKKGGHKRA